MPGSRSRNWEALSDTYRARLERRGVTREAYLEGVSLREARGHKETPERPERAFKHPERYQEYFLRIEKTQDHINAMMRRAVYEQEIFSYDRTLVDAMIYRASPAIRAQMRRMKSLDEYRAMAQYQQSKRYATTEYPPAMPWFVKMDGYWYNPFWYHA